MDFLDFLETNWLGITGIICLFGVIIMLYTTKCCTNNPNEHDKED